MGKGGPNPMKASGAKVVGAFARLTLCNTAPSQEPPDRTRSEAHDLKEEWAVGGMHWKGRWYPPPPPPGRPAYAQPLSP